MSGTAQGGAGTQAPQPGVEDLLGAGGELSQAQRLGLRSLGAGVGGPVVAAQTAVDDLFARTLDQTGCEQAVEVAVERARRELDEIGRASCRERVF